MRGEKRNLGQRYGDALREVREWSPKHADVIDKYVTKLRDEAAARRIENRELRDEPEAGDA